MRRLLGHLLRWGMEAGGVALVAVAAWGIWAPLGLLVVGLYLIIISGNGESS